MSANCSVRGCISKQYDDGITFFRFPTKPQQKEQWLKALNILALESPTISFVCSKHFEQKYIKTINGNQLLLPGAVPTKRSIRTYSQLVVPIQPNPSPSGINQNIIIKSLPIVVVPLQSTIYKVQQNTNEVKLNDHIPISENIEEVGSETESVISLNSNDEPTQTQNSSKLDACDGSETESEISINADNETQNSSKLDDSCYVLVEVADKKDNSQDDEAKIVASGINIEELINEAKIAIHNISPPNKKFKRSFTNYIGDCLFEDMDDPVVRKHHWTLALNEIHKLRTKVKTLYQQNRRLQTRLSKAKLMSQYKQNVDIKIDSDHSDDSL